VQQLQNLQDYSIICRTGLAAISLGGAKKILEIYPGMGKLDWFILEE
jgi:hypothetical protein